MQRLLRFPFRVRNIVKWVRFVGVFFVLSYSRGIDKKISPYVTVCPPLAVQSVRRLLYLVNFKSAQPNSLAVCSTRILGFMILQLNVCRRCQVI